MKTKDKRSLLITFMRTKQLFIGLFGLSLVALPSCTNEIETKPSSNQTVHTSTIVMNDLKREGFQGNIKLIIDSIYNPDNSCRMVMTNSYNTAGWITETNINFTETEEHQRHLYDIKDTIIAAKEQRLKGSTVVQENSYSIYINPDGTQSGALNALGAIKIINNSNGFWVKKVHAAGQICEEERVVDANGQSTKQVTRYWDRMRKNCTDRIIEVSFVNDKYGNPIEQVRHDNKTDKRLTALFEYSYDEQGNWVKQVTLDEQNTVQYITYRTIEYY